VAADKCLGLNGILDRMCQLIRQEIHFVKIPSWLYVGSSVSTFCRDKRFWQIGIDWIQLKGTSIGQIMKP
jgi:hypothetical protein